MAMREGQLSLKRVGIDKTNSRILAIVGGAAFLVVFFLVASIALFQQMMYQNRVISVKKKAVSQLEQNVQASQDLMSAYQAFVSTPQNIIGGNPEGTGPQDGSNAKLVLDALPSSYDFPALTTSIEKLLIDQKVKIQGITGTDDAVNQQATVATGSPEPIEMPFEVTVGGDFQAIQGVIRALERSIRPVQVQTVDVTGDRQDLTMKLTAKTYYQPEKTLNITKKVVK
ncbi:MAG TPA: type 4a pilus biogenesis protein PilO [Candidatus Saccharimonadales bacterium]|nr:type 4a pilus biogenesis protein PilO [Candidatus Saccharimonadales bacterium]